MILQFKHIQIQALLMQSEKVINQGDKQQFQFGSFKKKDLQFPDAYQAQVIAQKQSTFEYPTKRRFFVFEHDTQSFEENYPPSMTSQLNQAQYKFQPFDIKNNHEGETEQSICKPQPFMGAFIQTQYQFQSFDLNIRVPTLAEKAPFSRILNYELEDENTFRQMYKSSEDDKKSLKIEELSKIDSHEGFQENKSLFSNFEDFLDSDEALIKSTLWDENKEVASSQIYEVYQPKERNSIQKLQEKISFLEEDRIQLNDVELCLQMSKMIQGIQGEIFILDYDKMEWRYNQKPLKFNNFIVQSLRSSIEEILKIANFKSRIEESLKFIAKQPYRRIFQEVAKQAKEIMFLIQQIALETTFRDAPYLNFLLMLQGVNTQVLLIYELLINQQVFKTQERSFSDFNHTFLNSETVIFSQIIRLSASNDSLTNRMNQLVLRLLRSVFKPITFSLNRILFQETFQISHRDQNYLKLYFDNIKDILTFLGKRISLIKQESNQLYLICKVKEQIHLVTKIEQLREYEHRWRVIFVDKKKMLEKVKRKYRKKRKEQKQRKQQKRVKQIYQLKMKLLKNLQEQKKKKSISFIQGIKETERLKQQIAEREQRRRLNQLIQKQQEKGFLLEMELKEKRSLLRNKEILLQKAEQLGLSIIRSQSQIKQEQRDLKEKVSSFSEKELIKGEVEKEIESKVEEKMEQISQKRSQEQMMQKRQQEIKQIEKSMLENKEIEIESNLMIEEEQRSKSEQNQSQNKQSEVQDSGERVQEEQFHVSTNTALEICIDNVIRQQIEITHLAMGYLVYDRYQLGCIMQFLRKIFLTGNGFPISQLLKESVNFDSKINLKHFNNCVLFDGLEEQIKKLQPEFYEMKADSYMLGMINGRVSLFDENLQSYIGFQFKKLPLLLEPYFSYIHLSKYMQIFTFILRVKHANDLIAQSWKLLNQKKVEILSKNDYDQVRIMNKLYVTRYITHTFLNTLQDYLYYRVIEKEIKLMGNKLQQQELNELSALHLKMLDNIIKLGLIDNPHNDISKIIRTLIVKIKQFKNTIDMFCQDDLPTYLQNDVENQIDQMSAEFKSKKHFLQTLLYHT